MKFHFVFVGDDLIRSEAETFDVGPGVDKEHGRWSSSWKDGEEGQVAWSRINRFDVKKINFPSIGSIKKVNGKDYILGDDERVYLVEGQ